MNPIEMDRLIQNSLDGTSTAAESAQLDALLASSDAARRRHHELLSLFQALNRVPLAPAPEELGARVLAALPSRSPARGRTGWIPGLRESLTGPPVARLGFAFAAGLAAGAIAFSAWNGTLGGRAGSELQQATGTLAPHARSAAGSLEWTLEGTSVHVRAEDSRHVAVDIAGRGEAEITIESPAPAFGASAVQSSRPASSHVLLDPGRVRLAGDAGTTFVLEIPEAASPGEPLHVTARSGESSAEGDLPVRNGPPTAK